MSAAATSSQTTAAPPAVPVFQPVLASRVLVERRLLLSLGELRRLVKELDAAMSALADRLPQPGDSPASIILRCCVETRRFVDSLYSLFLLTPSESLSTWQEPFGKLVARILDHAVVVIPDIEARGLQLQAGQTRRYSESMRFRQNLAVKMNEGLDPIRDMLIHDLFNGGRELAKVQPSAEIAGLQNLNSLSQDGRTAHFALWQMIRMLKHRLLLSLAELTHETGPWTDSLDDHIGINTNTLDLVMPLKNLIDNKELQPWTDATSKILADISSLTIHLNCLRSRDVNLGLHWAVQAFGDEAKRKMERPISAAQQCYADLDCLERKIIGPLHGGGGQLNDAWNASVMRESGLENLLAFLSEHAPDQQTMKILPDWIDAVLFHGWSLEPPYECPENVALFLFRVYAEQNGRDASTYVTRYLSLPTADEVLHEQVALMFCGVLFRISVENPPAEEKLLGWEEWRNLALSLTKLELATDYSTAGRVALAAAFVSLAFAQARESAFVADQLHALCLEMEKTLRGQVSEEDQKRVDYFREHVLTNLETVPWGPDSPFQDVLNRLCETVAV